MKQLSVVMAFFMLSTSANAGISYNKQVKVADGTSVHCSKEEKGRFRNRYGAYRLMIRSLKCIKKDDNKHYLRAEGYFAYYSCDYSNKKDQNGQLKAQRLDARRTFKNIGLNPNDPNNTFDVNIFADQARVISFQDGVYTKLATTQIGMESVQIFSMDMPVEALNLDLSETASPFGKGRIDFSFQAQFNFQSKLREPSKKWVDFGDYRIHFDMEKVQSTPDMSQRWQFNLK